MEKKQRTAQRVLDAARELFTEYGYVDARAGDIAKTAGVAHGTVFAHFGSKSGLIVALMEEFFEERRDALDALAESARERGLNPEEEFWETLRHGWREDQKSLGLIRAFGSYIWTSTESIKAAQMPHRAAMRDRMRAILQNAELALPDDGLELEDRLELYYGFYREQLRTVPEGGEAAGWKEIEKVARFLFPFRKT